MGQSGEKNEGGAASPLQRAETNSKGSGAVALTAGETLRRDGNPLALDKGAVTSDQNI